MVVSHILCITFFDSCWKSFRVLFGLLPAQVAVRLPLRLLFNNCIIDWYKSPECLPIVLAPTHLGTGSPWYLCTNGSYNFSTDFFPNTYFTSPITSENIFIYAYVRYKKLWEVRGQRHKNPTARQKLQCWEKQKWHIGTNANICYGNGSRGNRMNMNQWGEAKFILLRSWRTNLEAVLAAFRERLEMKASSDMVDICHSDCSVVLEYLSYVY